VLFLNQNKDRKMKAAEQQAALAALVHQGNLLKTLSEDEATSTHPVLRNLVCMAIPVYNIYAASQGWPQIPLPAFCSVPTPPAK
jgi:hypothetical protein